jgi:hypothetical protein
MKGCIILPDKTQLEVEGDASQTSDCFHTFAELYDHRCLLFIALMKSHPRMSWRSLRHSDNSFHEGWFIAGMRTPSGDVTYHLPDSMWYALDGIEEKKVAPAWDGHTPADVVERLTNWVVDGVWR